MTRSGFGGNSAEASFRPDVATVGEARRFVSDILSAWDADALSWTAMLLVTELATNAVLHASTPYDVTLERRGDGTLRLGVTDGSVRKPRARDYAVDATTGRGLGLVESLALAWGTSSLDNGKTVWCDIAPDPTDELSAEPDLDAFLLDDDLDTATPSAPQSGRNADARMSWARVSWALVSWPRVTWTWAA
jgi:anti-sigma regulatory factor (Ser/Thr protein kinase)